MSIVERIKNIQNSQAEQAVRENSERNALTEKTKLEAEQKRQEQENAANRRKAFEESQTSKVLKESGVLKDIIAIENYVIEGSFKEHQLEIGAEGLILKWGSNVYKKVGDYDYSYISITVDADNERLSIRGAEEYVFAKDQWQNKENVEEALINSFLAPKRKFSGHISLPQTESDPWHGSGPTN